MPRVNPTVLRTSPAKFEPERMVLLSSITYTSHRLIPLYPYSTISITHRTSDLETLRRLTFSPVSCVRPKITEWASNYMNTSGCGHGEL